MLLIYGGLRAGHTVHLIFLIPSPALHATLFSLKLKIWSLAIGICDIIVLNIFYP